MKAVTLNRIVAGVAKTLADNDGLCLDNAPERQRLLKAITRVIIAEADKETIEN